MGAGIGIQIYNMKGRTKLVFFCKQKIWVDNLKTDISLSVAHYNTLTFLAITHNRVSLGIFNKLCNRIWYFLSLFNDWNRLDAKRLKHLFDFCCCTFVIWINQIEHEQLISVDVILVALNLISTDFTLQNNGIIVSNKLL